MSIFWISAALLMALAITLVLPVLIKGKAQAVQRDEAQTARQATLAILRDQLAQLNADLASGAIDAAQHQTAREEIERRVLEETASIAVPTPAARPHGAGQKPWVTAAGLAVAIPLVTTLVYQQVGNPAAIEAPAAPVAQAASDDVSEQQVEALVKQLADRMESNPDDLAGWTLLARTYAAMRRFPEAAKAFERATALSPNDASLLADRADALAMVQGQRVAGEPAQLIARAIEIDPKNLKALALAGSVAFEEGNFNKAIEYWGRARELAPPAGDFARNLDEGLRDAQVAMGGSPSTSSAAAPVATPAAPTPPATAAPGSARVTGRVTLSPELQARVSAGDTVFVFARAVEGPRMPLAILRKTAAELPISFTLDDSMSMSPAMKLSNFPRVVVGARISKTGNAMPSPGDLTGQIADVKVGAEGLQIVIDSVQP